MKDESWIPGHKELGGGILGVVDRIVCWLVAGGLFSMVAILMIQVISRYVFNASTVWSEELAVSLFVWVSMLAIPLGLRRGEHLTLDILSKRLSPRVNKIVAIGIAAITILTFAIIGYYAAKLAPAADRQLLAGIAGGLGIQAKVSWIYLAVPVGAALSIIFTIERLVLMLTGKVTVMNADADTTFIEQLEEELEDVPAASVVPGSPASGIPGAPAAQNTDPAANDKDR